MIIAKLKGGLGNQLFQYSFGRRMSIVAGEDLKLDAQDYYEGSYRFYDLSNFNIKAEIASKEEIKNFKYPLGVFSKVQRGINSKILKKHNIGFNKNNLISGRKRYLDGYWQSEKYFFDIRDVLLKELTLKNDLSEFAKNIKDKELNSNSVSIHVRRGDYVKNKKTP